MIYGRTKKKNDLVASRITIIIKYNICIYNDIDDDNDDDASATSDDDDNNNIMM